MLAHSNSEIPRQPQAINICVVCPLTVDAMTCPCDQRMESYLFYYLP